MVIVLPLFVHKYNRIIVTIGIRSDRKVLFCFWIDGVPDGGTRVVEAGAKVQDVAANDEIKVGVANLQIWGGFGTLKPDMRNERHSSVPTPYAKCTLGTL